jgi:2',3'-cyclic-nucleotide 2'-phosphodiesterase (5'-nucleotidase family)
MKVKYLTFFLRTIFLGICVLNINDGVDAHFNLTVLHVNDIHARIEQTNKYTGYCEKEDAGR